MKFNSYVIKKLKAEVATGIENSPPSTTDPVISSEPVAEPQIQPQVPPVSKPPESNLDPTDLSDTTESEAEKHGCK